MKHFIRAFPLALVVALAAVAFHFAPAKAGPVDFSTMEFVTFSVNGSPHGINLQDGLGGWIDAHGALPVKGGRYEAQGAVILPSLAVNDAFATVSWALNADNDWTDIRFIANGSAFVEQSRVVSGSTVSITFTRAVSRSIGQLKKFYAQ